MVQDDPIRLNRNHPVPLHHQLREILERQIRSGVWGPHEMIPTETELVEHYEISRAVVRQALAALVAEGLLYRQQGKGTFVAPVRIAQPLDSLLGFAEVLQAQGYHPEISVLGVETLPATQDLASALAITEGEPCIRLERRVDLRGEPLFWDHSFFPASFGILPDPEVLSVQPLFQWLEAAGFTIAEASHAVSARLATPEEASVLQLDRSSPVIVVRRLAADPTGRPLVLSRATYRGDVYEYRITLRRRGF